jgi:hypothetical protein
MSFDRNLVNFETPACLKNKWQVEFVWVHLQLSVHRPVKCLTILTKMKTIQLVCLATLCSAIGAQSPLVRGGADKSFQTPSVDENIRKLNEIHSNLQGLPCNVMTRSSAANSRSPVAITSSMQNCLFSPDEAAQAFTACL